MLSSGDFNLPVDAGIYDEAIEPALKELQKIDPDYIVPFHCRGWKAANTNHRDYA